MKYGECPPGQSYTWEQQLCPASVVRATEHQHGVHPAVPSTFESMAVFELFHANGDDVEARGLATRRMHAKLAPQVTENPM